jgi:hypothetical protein
MPTANLPRSANENYQSPEPRGEWIQRDAKEMASVADGIIAPPNLRFPHSIPDVWKRALVFGDVLCSDPAKKAALPGSDYAADAESMTLEQRIVGEWRGALAILAFWDVRNWGWLAAEPVELAAAPETRKELSFLEVLEKLMPKDVSDFIEGSITWTRFHVLRGPQGDPFALTSPMSLLFTAEDYHGRIDVPWMNAEKKGGRKFLTDPLNGPHLSRREKKWLAEWVASIHAGLKGMNPNGGRAQSILAQLDAFQKSAGGGATPSPARIGKMLGLVDKKVSRPGDSLYGLLDGAIAPVPSETDVEVVQKRSTNQYFLIEPTLAHAWRRDAREIVIYGALTLADALQNPLAKPAVLIPSTKNCYWCTKDFFLEKRIVVFDNEANALPGARLGTVSNAGVRTPIPPLRKEALELFPALDLAKELTLDWVAKDRIVARLNLTLKGNDNPAGTRVTIEQEYEGDNIQWIDSLNIPVVKIWPNFVFDNWKTYYTYVSLTGAELRMYPYQVPASESRDYVEGPQGFAVYRTSTFPEAMICTYAFRNLAQQRPDEISAVLPLTPPGKLEQTAQLGTAIAGIDLGSTGSIVFLKVGQADPDRFPLIPRLYSVTRENKAFEIRSDREFLPNDDPVNPRQSNDILSVFQVHGNPPGGEKDRIPLCDGHILYLKTPEQFIDDQTKNVESNLKWGGARERYLARDFLRQLALQTATEALVKGANQIEWRFSYPTAFSPDDVSNFRAIWSEIAAEANKRTGIGSTLADEGTSPKFCEAVSAARYFSVPSHGGMATDVGALSIDVGGGTSDYAFWRDRSLSLHNSVLLAGRDIFLNPLRQRPDFLSLLDPNLGGAVARIKKLRQTVPHAANAQIDATIARKGNDLRMALNFHNEPAVQNFRHILEVGLSGILYYGGLLLRRQVLMDNFAPGDLYAIYAGGNGSNLFHWAAGHEFTGTSSMAVRLNEVFREASGIQSNIQIRLSTAPKSEVAYGLVNTDVPLTVQGKTAGLVACEGFLSGPLGQRTAYEWHQDFPVADLRRHGISVHPDLPEFSRFLKAIGEPLDVVKRADLVGRVNNRLAALQSEALKASDDQHAAQALMRGEPIWIVTFKTYLEDRINAWSTSF